MSPVYKHLAVSEALSPVFTALNEWIDATALDWTNFSAPFIPLPQTIHQEDLSKVAVYSLSVRDIETLARLVEDGQSRNAFTALVLLAELVPKAHPRQMETLQNYLQETAIAHIARNGHPQCRPHAGKLFLRAWGHLSNTSCIEIMHFAQYPHPDVLMQEVLCAVERSVLAETKQLHEFAAAILSCGGLVPQIVERIFAFFLTTTDIQAKDGAALLFSSYVQRRDGRNYLLTSVQMLQSVLQYTTEVHNAPVKGTLMHTIACLTETEDGKRLVHLCGGVAALGQFLLQQEEQPDFHTMILGHSPETVFEMICKLTFHLLLIPEALHEIEETQILPRLQRLSKMENFLRHPRSPYIARTYMTPAFRAL